MSHLLPLLHVVIYVHCFLLGYVFSLPQLISCNTSQPLLFTAYTTVTLTKNNIRTDLDISYDNKLICTAYDTKFLGKYVESIQYRKTHAEQSIHKLSAACYVIRSVKPFMSQETIKTIYYALKILLFIHNIDFSLLLFVANNRGKFILNFFIFITNNRQKLNFYQSPLNLSLYQKGIY